jgi:hypothetical protein
LELISRGLFQSLIFAKSNVNNVLGREEMELNSFTLDLSREQIRTRDEVGVREARVAHKFIRVRGGMREWGCTSLVYSHFYRSKINIISLSKYRGEGGEKREIR